MDFGFTLRPVHTVERTVALARQAEAAGFGYGWLDDAHGGKDIYSLLTLMAMRTERLRLGPCVTNPATRDITVTASVLATLDEISGGRMELGLGRGDSAQRVLGKGPYGVRPLDHAAAVVRDLVAGRSAAYGDVELVLPWAQGHTLPIWFAGYEPVVLVMAGRAADGIILGLADVDYIDWMASLAREAAAEIQRDPAAVKVQVAVPAYVGPAVTGRERVRWFPAAVARRVADVLDHYPGERLPEALRGQVRTHRGHDAETGSATALSDETIERFCLIGPAEDHVRRLVALHRAGVDQFNVLLMSGDEEAQLEAYAHDVVPAFRSAIGQA